MGSLSPVSVTSAKLTYASALGVYDGNAYESLWKRTRLEPLNATEVTEGYEVRISSVHLRGGAKYMPCRSISSLYLNGDNILPRGLNCERGVECAARVWILQCTMYYTSAAS